MWLTDGSLILTIYCKKSLLICKTLARKLNKLHYAKILSDSVSRLQLNTTANTHTVSYMFKCTEIKNLCATEKITHT